MFYIKKKKSWDIAESELTPEGIYLGRRKLIKNIGKFSIAAPLMNLAACSGQPVRYIGDKEIYSVGDLIHNYHDGTTDLYPADLNKRYSLGRELTDETQAASFNNFYEFSTNKTEVSKITGKFKSHPWSIEIAGLVKNPQTIQIDDLIRKFPLEERNYRLRCVEAWSIAVPWTGFSLKKLIDLVEPESKCKFVRFISFSDPDAAIGQRSTKFTWPYYEGLTIEEATNELSFMATGIYGHPLPKQHGAPIRLVVPWKYGYKNIKSIVKIEFVEEQPGTFWNDFSAESYDFTSNVDPDHSRVAWSQKTERMLGRSERIDTLPFNGYGEFVADLYT